MTEIPDLGPSIPVSTEQMRAAALRLAQASLEAGEKAVHDLAYFLTLTGLARQREDERFVAHNALNTEPLWHQGAAGTFQVSPTSLDCYR